MEIELEEFLMPNHGKMNYKEGYGRATILDAELDPVECSFVSDGTVELRTEDLVYVKLTKENLYNLIELIKKDDRRSE